MRKTLIKMSCKEELIKIDFKQTRLFGIKKIL